MQPGSFLFMDGDYSQNQALPAEGGAAGCFEQSLLVRAAVISSDDTAGRRVLDAGSKAVDLLSGPPSLAKRGEAAYALGKSFDKVEFKLGGDEHGCLVNVPPGALPIGSVVDLVPSHCDPTVNLHSHFIGIRGGTIEDIFEIDARGW